MPKIIKKYSSLSTPIDEKKDVLPDPIHTSKEKKVRLNLREQLKHLKKPLLIVLVFIAGILLITPIVTYIYFVRDLSSKENIISKKNSGVILTDRNDKPFFTFYQARTTEIASLSAIRDYTENAVIAVEDKDFYKHPGFSIRGIGRALLANFREERLAQGGSTISQQLIKNTLLNQNKSFLRKYQELVLAIELERRFSKKDILEMYLNTVYFGEGAFGIEDAAQTYFNKSASELTLGESALLVAILPAPSALSPISGDKDRAFARQAIVLAEMRKQQFIDIEDEQQAKAEKITFISRKDDLNQIAPHFALMVKEELIKRYGEQQVAQSGFTVKTTLDLKAQAFAEQTVKNQVLRLATNKVTNGAAVSINPKTGEIVTLVGSWDWSSETNGKINMALKPRQPGSSFKPLVYAKAFEDRILTPGSLLDDKEISFPGGYKPKNYDGRFRGNVTVRRALSTSLNIPAVLALDKIGVGSGIEFAERLGITTLKDPSHYGLSLVLGAAEIPLIEMTSAFGTFANSGIRAEPFTIVEIRDKKGNAIYTHNVSEKEVVDENVAFLISSILSDNNARAEVFGNALTISRPAAVKTGTTENYRDSLTVGYTPSLVVGVWIGNNDNAQMDGVAGSLGAAPIWRLIMENILAGTPIEKFNPTSGVVTTSVCEQVIKKETPTPAPDKPEEKKEDNPTIITRQEYFLRGTEPKEGCTLPSPTSMEITPSSVPTEMPKPTDKPAEIPSPTDVPTPTEEPTPTTIIQITLP